MKIFLTQPRLQYFLLSSLTLPFFGGVTSQTVVLDAYAGPDPVVKDTQIKFTGTATSKTASFPTGISFVIKYANGQPDSSICNMDFSVCDSTLDITCYCSSNTGNIYYFVIQIKATLERNNAFISDDLDTTRVAFPQVIERPTTVTSTTITTTPDDGDCDCIWWIIIIVVGVFVLIALAVVLIYICWWKKKKCAAVKTGGPSATPATPATPAAPATTIELDTTYNNSRATSQ